MAESDHTDFQRLAREAAESAYNPRAKHCWWLLHEWSMWEKKGRSESRRCLKCGTTQIRRLGACGHVWRTIQKGPIVAPWGGDPIGNYYEQECTECGELRMVKLTT